MMIKQSVSSIHILQSFLGAILLCCYGIASAGGGFSLTDTTGKRHTLSQYKGKWVIVNYWATWCPPCLEEVPDLVALYDSRKGRDVQMFGVVFDYENTKEVAEYVDDMLMSYPIVLGDDAVVKQIGAADVLPTTYIYNPKGELVKTKRGKVSRAHLEEIMSGARK
jgi:thiol-disulfide isomerase/thioredoxin